MNIRSLFLPLILAAGIASASAQPGPGPMPIGPGGSVGQVQTNAGAGQFGGLSNTDATQVLLGTGLYGPLTAANQPCGVATNVRLAKSASYTLANPDCGATVALGGNAFFPLTAGPPAGYTSTFSVVVENEDIYNGVGTGRGKQILLWTGSSTSSQSIVNTGQITFTVPSSFPIVRRNRYRVVSTSDVTKWMSGIGSFSGGTFTFTPDTSAGSGTFADWQIYQENILYPRQTMLLYNSGGVWNSWLPPKWSLPRITIQVFVDPSLGVGNSDGLAAGTGAYQLYNAAVFAAYDNFQVQHDPSTSVQINGTGTSVGTDALHIAGLFAGQQGNANIVVDGGGTAVWQTTSGGSPPVALFDGATIQLQNITLQSSTSNAIEVGRGAHGIIGAGVTLGPAAGAQISCNAPGTQVEINIGTTLNISGGATNFALCADGARLMLSGSNTVNFTADAPYSDAFLANSNLAIAEFNNATFALNGHSVTGVRFKLSTGSVTSGGGAASATYFPGGTAGTQATGAIYDSTPAGISATKTVRAAGGASDCTMIFSLGILTGGSC